jgi:predicted alpha/beta hydrolase
MRATGALPVRGTVVIHSATGVPCKFYNAFAAYLSEQAFDVFLWDARGIGKSATVHARMMPPRCVIGDSEINKRYSNT